jgi:hypothetical protein
MLVHVVPTNCSYNSELIFFNAVRTKVILIITIGAQPQNLYFYLRTSYYVTQNVFVLQAYDTHTNLLTVLRCSAVTGLKVNISRHVTNPHFSTTS